MRYLIHFLIWTAPLQAQLFSYGTKVGTPLTGSVVNSGSVTTGTSHYLLGPTAELRIPGVGIGVEVDALYRRFTIGSAVSEWEFPILLKYRFPGLVVHPFVDAGASFNYVLNPSLALNPLLRNQILHKTSSGFAMGGGLEYKALILRLTPELRYTHWGTQNLSFGTVSGLGTSQNQVEFLVGITF